MEPLEFKPITTQLLNIIHLSDEERATIYSVLRADLVLQEEVMR